MVKPIIGEMPSREEFLRRARVYLANADAFGDLARVDPATAVSTRDQSDVAAKISTELVQALAKTGKVVKPEDFEKAALQSEMAAAICALNAGEKPESGIVLRSALGRILIRAEKLGIGS